MNYRDPNLQAPDIAQYFPHLHSRVMPHSMGQEVFSDWADLPDLVKCEKCRGVGAPWNNSASIPCETCNGTGTVDHPLKLYKACGILSPDEAAILYQCTKQIGGEWLDIGCHTGWTALHMALAGARVVGLDPMLANADFYVRADGNISRALFGSGVIHKQNWLGICLKPETSRMYLDVLPAGRLFDGVMIDGDHCWGEPEYDAEQSFKHLNPRGVILMHDFIGGPVTKAVSWLMAQGMKCRIYSTSSQLLAVTWRGEFQPPDYTPDPRVDWPEYRRRVTDFNWRECV